MMKQYEFIFNKEIEHDKWVTRPESRLYDYKLIASRLEHLRKAREADDVDNMTYLLRGGLLRNFGGICDRKLFSHSYIG
jgi:TAG lipase/lysophosphatidylethanolamine acyltransferase